MPRQHEFPEYASCEVCGEYYTATLRIIDGHIICRNCADASNHVRRHCAICWRVAPSERHHVASERQHTSLILPVCLNCHAILSRRQDRWPQDWRTSRSHPLRCVVQGVYDVLCLWLERSPVAEQTRDLFAMLAHAALIVLAYLRYDALADLATLTDWRVV